MNGIAFTAWIQQSLIPTMQRDDVVIVDNLGSHKRKLARNTIRNAAAHLFFLPPYKPDLNPIEMVFAKLKTLVRKSDERTAETHGGVLESF
ncbi:transposase [Agrobacterium larrymoorei]|uniref:Transposase n=1 Tax=Agrobacterium larrymoorei TaxID=160699 RepID=A0AAF0HEY8_9HYPH|nr:transposase [Agrobacterium larrymoorei]WHA43490.1 transposase [Agrobacterium larrymoorei]